MHYFQKDLSVVKSKCSLMILDSSIGEKNWLRNYYTRLHLKLECTLWMHAGEASGFIVGRHIRRHFIIGIRQKNEKRYGNEIRKNLKD